MVHRAQVGSQPPEVDNNTSPVDRRIVTLASSSPVIAPALDPLVERLAMTRNVVANRPGGRRNDRARGVSENWKVFTDLGNLGADAEHVSHTRKTLCYPLRIVHNNTPKVKNSFKKNSIRFSP